MLHHPTLDLLHELGLHGMAQGFSELSTHTEAATLDHAEWLALLLEREATLRRQKSFEARARTAKLRHASSSMSAICGRCWRNMCGISIAGPHTARSVSARHA
jgi:hypothetical protein